MLAIQKSGGARQKSVDIYVIIPATLVHGSYHLKQWYVRSKSDMGLGDWQAAASVTGRAIIPKQ